MTTKLVNKVSHQIETQLPDFVRADHQLFASFVEDYFQFLESAKVTLDFTTDYLILEPETKGYLLSENGILGAAVDRIVLESSTEYTPGEIVKGSRSGAEAKVIVEDVRNVSLYIGANNRFEIGENIVGQTSGATAKIVTYKANPVQNIQQLLDYADVDNSLFEFFDQIKESFMATIPNSLASNVSKRNLVKSIRDLYAAKGTSEGHKVFMRLLLDESAEIFYPNENMLRVSDGKWRARKLIRVSTNGSGSGQETVNQVITGQTSGATAVVASASTFQQGTTSVIELAIEDLSQGDPFVTGEEIKCISNSLDLEISFTIKSIINQTNLDNPGILHSASEAAVIDTDKGNGFADVLVNSLKRGSVSDTFIQTAGTGYRLGEKVLFSSAGGENEASGIISILGGGIELETATDTTSGLLLKEIGTTRTAEEFNIQLESNTVLDGPYYVFATGETKVNGKQQLSGGAKGYYYPLFLTQAGAGGADNSNPFKFVEFPGITFYMPAAERNYALSSAPTGQFNSEDYISYPVLENDKIILDRTDGSGANAGGRIISDETQVTLDTFGDDNDQIFLEPGTFDIGTASSIRKIFLTDKGQGYVSLPTVTVETAAGSGAKILALTNDIGGIESLKINDSGFDYDANDLPDMRFRAHFVLKDITGSFVAGDQLTSHTGVVKSFNADTQQLDVTLEDIVKIRHEQAVVYNAPFVQESNEGLAGHHVLMEDVKDLPGGPDDNIVLNGTSIVSPPTRFIEVKVKKVRNADNTANVFEIDNVRQKSLKLVEGNTYYFDLSDSSLYDAVEANRHRLRFSETPDGTHASGTAYTTGVTESGITIATGTEGAYIQITIASNAPTLYYYCVNHSGMGGIVETNTPQSFVTDAGGNVLLNGTSEKIDHILAEPVNGANPLLKIALEDNSGNIITEQSIDSPLLVANAGSKLLIDNDIDVQTTFILDENGARMKNEDHGNLITLEDSLDSGKILDETDVSAADFIVLDGTNSDSKNAADSLILNEKIDFLTGGNVEITTATASGKVLLSDIATGTINAGVQQTTEGAYNTIDSLIGEDLIRVQDSYYYQQFSYEVQVGQSVSTYINELRKAVHPSGFAPFGKVSIASFINLGVQTSGGDTFSPILGSVLTALFDEKFSRTHIIPDSENRIGNRGDAILINSTAGSSTDAGDNFLFEDGTIDQFGKGGIVMAETSLTPGGKAQNHFIPTYNMNILSKATPRAPQNFLRTISDEIFPDSEGIQLEGSELDTLRLDGIDPLPQVAFLVLNATAVSGTNAGDNILLESSTGEGDTSRMLLETSSFTFDSAQVLSVNSKILIEDSLKTYDSIPLSEFEGLRLVDILRPSKILLGQPSDILTENNRHFTSKIIEEFDGVSPLELEDNSGFFNLEDGLVTPELLSNRGLDNGTSDINQAGVDDSDGIKLEIDGFLKLDGHLITSGPLTGQVVDSDEFIISERVGSASERFILEEDGVIVVEDFSTNSVQEHLLMEDATMVPGAKMKAEKTTQKNFADAFLLEDAAQEVATDSLVLDGTDGSGSDAGFKVLSEQDIDDAAILVENILLESSNIFADEGQIPHDTLELSGGPKKFNKDIPLLVVTLGSQPIVKSSVIEVRSA
jgi:hypothetical protein